MKIGRNDPCHCGSGKKYKQCCLKKDEEARRAERTPEPTAPSIPTPAPPPPAPVKKAPPPDPRIQAFNARWEAFEKEDGEGQIALFLETLEEKELMDEEMAFEMLNVIYGKTIERNERDRFDNLVETLRRRLPDIYAHNASCYLDWRITNALVAGRFEAASVLTKEIVETAGRDIDTFNNVLDRLAYYGQLSTLVEAVRAAWPAVKDSSNIVSWGIDEFVQQAADFEIFDYLECLAAPDPDGPELQKRLEFYLEIDSERLSRYLIYLTGQTDRRWSVDDFVPSRTRKKSRRRAGRQADAEAPPPTDPEQNLFDLTVEFLGYLRREENVPYPRGELAREQIQSYILKRRAGDLAPRESMLEAMMRPPESKPKPKPRPQPAHPLCPDRETLDRHLADLMHFINPQYYKVAATLELTPAWLRFLASRHLIDDQQYRNTYENLRKLRNDLLNLWEKTAFDPLLQRNLEHAWPE